MTRNFIAFSLGVLSLLYSTGAQAAMSNEATVPFSFVAGGVEMPAGQYLFDQDPASHIITISDLHTGRKTFVFTATEQALPMTATAKIVFNRYGSQHYLAQVWSGPAGMARMLPASAAEVGLRSHMVAGIGPQNRNQDTVAMK